MSCKSWFASRLTLPPMAAVGPARVGPLFTIVRHMKSLNLAEVRSELFHQRTCPRPDFGTAGAKKWGSRPTPVVRPPG
jgi:hypothetical protein